MIATNDELALLEKWKRKLCLREWRIEIINPAYYGDRILPFDFEKTLVHELLHLKFSFWCQNEDDVGDRVMHQMIDDLARALTEGDSDDEA